MSAFTPGPWAVNTVPTSIGHCNKIEPIGACLYVDHRGAGADDEKSATSLANARLIAAAPDLLSAARFVMAFYEPGQRHLDTEAWKRAEAQMRAAIAKAITP